MIECWKAVGDYEVCWKTNKIRRAKKGFGANHAKVGKILKTYITKRGYIGIRVKIDGKNYFYFHQLVALAYHGPCPAGKEVNHDDGNKKNNDPENLLYQTHAENMKHASVNELFNRKITAEVARKIVQLHSTKKWTLKQLGKKYDIDLTTVWGILNGKCWKYIEE